MTNPYSELIEKIEECADAFTRDQDERDYQLVQYEKFKVFLLVLLLISTWIMFFLLWTRLDDLPVNQPAPSGSHPSPEYQPRDEAVARGEQ